MGKAVNHSTKLALIGAVNDRDYPPSLLEALAKHGRSWTGWTFGIREEIRAILDDYVNHDEKFNLYFYMSLGSDHRGSKLVECRLPVDRYVYNVKKSYPPEPEICCKGDSHYLGRTWFHIREYEKLSTPLPLSSFTRWNTTNKKAHALRSAFEYVYDLDPKRLDVLSTVVESEESVQSSDSEDTQNTEQFLLSLKPSKIPQNTRLPGKNDQLIVKRTALSYNLKPYSLVLQRKKVTIFSDKDITPNTDRISTNYAAFYTEIENIQKILKLPKDFLRIAYINPQSDARYQKDEDSHSIFVNLATFENKRNFYYWLFSVARELTYIKTHQFGYGFVNELRRIMIYALNNMQTKDHI